MRHFISCFNDSVKKHWDLPAVTNFGKETYTYGQMAEGMEKYHILFEEAGIKKGDKIAIYARNSAEWCIAYFATLTYDAVTVPFLPDFLPAAVAELASFSECKMLIIDDVAFNAMNATPELYEQLEKTKNFAGVLNIKDISILRDTTGKLAKVHENMNEMLSARHPKGLTADSVNYYKEERDMNAPVEISFTSGTTSATSKGVVLPARSLSVNLEFGFREIPTCVGGHIFAILPMAHMFGQTFDVIFPLSSGCHVHVMPGKPTPARLLAGLAAVKPFMFLTVPMVIEKIFKSKVFPATRTFPAKLLLKIPGLDRIVLNKIRKSLLSAFGNGFTTGVIIGGAALNREVEDLLKRMKFPYVVGYGMTECGPLISYRDKSEYVKYSCGTNAHPIEIRIDSANPRRVLGEIQVKGDAVMLGYYNNEEASFQRPYSEKTAELIDNEVKEMIKEQYERAKRMLQEHSEGHHRLANLLIEREVIFAEDVEEIFGKRPWASRSEEIFEKNESNETNTNINEHETSQENVTESEASEKTTDL